MKFRIYIIGVIVNLSLISLIAGCVSTADYKIDQPSASKISKQGIYHKVRPGETLWRIAKLYGVDVDDIIQSNRIPNVAHIEKDQLIFIPGAENEKKTTTDASGPNTASDTEFLWPLKGKVISYFGDAKGAEINSGIDIQFEGEGIVCAARGGEVVFADFLTGYAQTIILDHGDGFFTVYGKNTRLSARVGDRVARGSAIALLEKNDPSSFLHFEVRKGGQSKNPLYYLP
ncbi:MAG: peptidoglycan DD-metalloendopeptidase family protein [Candidatus Omnitrophota bacterium]